MINPRMPLCEGELPNERPNNESHSNSRIPQHRHHAAPPRPSLEARYASRDAWAARLAEAVDRLVAERLLLAEDGDRLAIAARESWDVYREL
jgi:hypothetical protein